MFAPNPSDWEGYVSATVTYKDGTVKNYLYPRMYELDLGIKYFKERYRKFLERARMNSFDWIRPRFALRIAAKNFTDPNNPPALVELYVHEAVVPKIPPFTVYAKNAWSEVTKGNFSLDVISPQNPKLPPYKATKYFSYVVPRDQLKEMAGF